MPILHFCPFTLSRCASQRVWMESAWQVSSLSIILLPFLSVLSQCFNSLMAFRILIQISKQNAVFSHLPCASFQPLFTPPKLYSQPSPFRLHREAHTFIIAAVLKALPLYTVNADSNCHVLHFKSLYLTMRGNKSTQIVLQQILYCFEFQLVLVRVPLPEEWSFAVSPALQCLHGQMLFPKTYQLLPRTTRLIARHMSSAAETNSLGLTRSLAL
jgi:hypothetical protein